MCEVLDIETPPADFERCLATLEGTFISIDATKAHRIVRFADPSVVDFIVTYVAKSAGQVSTILRAAEYFSQLERLLQLGRSTMQDAASNFESQDDKRRRAGQIFNALASTGEASQQFGALFHSDEVLSWSWDSDAYVRQPPDLEARLALYFKLPEQLRPDHDWFEHRISELPERWLREGRIYYKDGAVRLHELMVASKQLDSGIVSRYRTQLMQHLNDTSTFESMDDWAPFLDLINSLPPPERPDYGDDFRDFFESELHRWQPSPPDFDRLLEYAEDLGILPEFDEQVDAARDAERAAEQEAAEQRHRMIEKSWSQSSSTDQEAETNAIHAIFSSKALRDR